MRHLLRLGALLILPAALVFAAGCGDDDDDGGGGTTTPRATTQATTGAGGDEAEVEAVIRAAVSAWNAKNVEALLELFTDEGLEASFGEGDEAAEDGEGESNGTAEAGTTPAAGATASETTPAAGATASETTPAAGATASGGSTRDEFRTALTEFIGEPQITIGEFNNTEVDGEDASTEVLWSIGKVRENIKFSLVDEAGDWKINNEEDLLVEIPEGTRAIPVDLNEFAFGMDVTAVNGTGPFALEGSNVGEQPHEMALAKIPADADIQEILTTEEDVPGFEFIGGVGPVDPDGEINLVFTEQLEPGRYLLVCFLPNTDEPEGPPHALLGMTKEFTIEGTGGATTPAAGATP